MGHGRVIELRNIVDGEGLCSCGCGKDSTPRLLWTLQAFVDALDRDRGKTVRVFWNGARCQAKNAAVPGSAQFSLHLTGEAADCRFEEYDGTRWVKIPSVQVASLARACYLWGGIGWKKYLPTPGHIHLDIRDGGRPVEW